MHETTCRKTYTEQLPPTPQQGRMLDEVLWRRRDLYNTALEQRSTAWQRCHVSLSRYEQEAEPKDIRAAFPEYSALHRHALQDVLARLDKTYQAFFRRLERGEKAGFPRFKSQTRYHSFTFKECGNGSRLDNGVLVLAKIGRIGVHWSRPLAGTPKTVTLTKVADGWYVAISCAEVPVHPLPPTGRETGIDLGLESFATLADATLIHNPRCYRKAEAYLRRRQRRVARRKQGSHRWRRKAVKLLAKTHQYLRHQHLRHQHLRHQRRDFQHKAALQLVRQYDVISYEDLRIRNMVKNHHLAKSISDASWRAFLTSLAFTAAGARKRVQAVDPTLTSQTCSGCGREVWKGLSVCWHECPYEDCGRSLHRGSQRRPKHAATGPTRATRANGVGGGTAFRRERSGMPHA
ncbi:MAG TPA: transposase [Ktedonobacterales bacterium]|nr:transposase [Ktedonobacterales bacterium]